MNSRVLQIALRLSLIQEEYSERDIAQAVRLLERHGSSSALLEFLASQGSPQRTPRKVSRGKGKTDDLHPPKAILELEGKDPEKFELLSEFNKLIRMGNVLPELGDVRRLGERLSKDFAAGGSRRDAVAKLVELMAMRPIQEIRDIVADALHSPDADKKSTDYQELARFIISGRSAQ
jgi:hypothetical protein